MKHFYHNWKLVLCASAMMALGCLIAADRSALAQNPAAGWANRNDFKPAAKSTMVQFPQLTTVLRRGTFDNPTEQQAFTDYYNKYLFPMVTHTDNRQSVSDVIPKLRNHFMTSERATGGQQVFGTLAGLTLAYMKNVAKEDYNTTLRVNAVVAIGEVNTTAAVSDLLDLIGPAGQIDAIRVAAMAGLVHLSEPRPRTNPPLPPGSLSTPAVADPVIAKMIRIVRASVPKTSRADAIRWMRGQAADILGNLKSTSASTGPSMEVPAALLVMLSDKDMPVPLRSKAARALGKLDYGGSPPAAAPYLTALAELARDAMSSDQPVDRGRAELVVRDVGDGLKPFAAAALPADQRLVDGLQRALQTFTKETLTAPPPDKLKDSIDKAENSIAALLKP